MFIHFVNPAILLLRVAGRRARWCAGVTVLGWAVQEDDSRWFFQQLIVGLDYCHKMVRAWALRRRCLHCEQGDLVVDVVYECLHRGHSKCTSTTQWMCVHDVWELCICNASRRYSGGS